MNRELFDYPTLTTMAHAEQYAAQQGIRLTATDREQISRVQLAEKKRLRVLAQQQERSGAFKLVEVFNRLYPRLLESLLGIGEVLLTFTQTLIIAFGVPLVLVLLLIVEQQRVVHGILLFEVDPALAYFAATALVILNLVLEFTIEHLETRTGFRAPANTEFSLRNWLSRTSYVVGVGAAWTPKEASPARRYKNLLRLVTVAILALALAGSMRPVIEQTDGAWHQAIRHILFESSLMQIAVWIAGLLFAVTAVFAAQGLSRYVAVRCAEIVASMRTRQTGGENELNEAVETVGIQYVLAKVAASKQKHANGASEVALSDPFRPSQSTHLRDG